MPVTYIYIYKILYLYKDFISMYIYKDFIYMYIHKDFIYMYIYKDYGWEKKIENCFYL